MVALVEGFYGPLHLSCSCLGRKKELPPPGFPESKPRPWRINFNLDRQPGGYKREIFSKEFFVSSISWRRIKATRKIFNHQVIKHLKGSRFLNNQYFMDSFRDPGSDVRHWTQKFHVTKPLDVKKWTTHRGGWILHDFSRGNQPTVPVGGVCYSRFTAPWSWRPLPSSGFGSESFHGLEVVKNCRRFGVLLPESQVSMIDSIGVFLRKGGRCFFVWKIQMKLTKRR